MVYLYKSLKLLWEYWIEIAAKDRVKPPKIIDNPYKYENITPPPPYYDDYNKRNRIIPQEYSPQKNYRDEIPKPIYSPPPPPNYHQIENQYSQYPNNNIIIRGTPPLSLQKNVQSYPSVNTHISRSLDFSQPLNNRPEIIQPDLRQIPPAYNNINYPISDDRGIPKKEIIVNRSIIKPNYIPADEYLSDPRSIPDSRYIPDNRSSQDYRLSSDYISIPDSRPSPDSRIISNPRLSPDPRLIQDSRSSPDSRLIPSNSGIPSYPKPPSNPEQISTNNSIPTIKPNISNVNSTIPKESPKKHISKAILIVDLDLTLLESTSDIVKGNYCEILSEELFV